MTDVIISEKEKKSAPTKIAPITLVATNVMSRRITENNIVPNMPIDKANNGVQVLLQVVPFWTNVVEKSVTARYRTAMPKATIEKIGVKVITPVI